MMLVVIASMPALPYLFANEFIEVLKKKHASGTFKEMVRKYNHLRNAGLFFFLLHFNKLTFFSFTTSSG